MKDWFKANKGKLGTYILITLFVILFVWGRTADATEIRLGVGLGITHQKGSRYHEAMLISTDKHWYAAATRIGGDHRHNYQYWRITAGYRVNWRQDKTISPFMRFGTAYFTEQPTDYISDSWAFDMAIGIRVWDVLEIEFDQHNSTGGRTNQNEGLDAVLIGITMPFGRK